MLCAPFEESVFLREQMRFAVALVADGEGFDRRESGTGHGDVRECHRDGEDGEETAADI